MPEVSINIFNCYAEIIGVDDQILIDAISRVLSYTQSNSRYSFAFKSGHWDGRVRLLSRNMQFPAGLVDDVRAVMAGFGINPTIKDMRQSLSTTDKLAWHGHSLRDYQKKAVERAIDEGRGTMKMATGAGKTTVIAALCGAYNTHAVVYVVSLDLLTQVKDTLEESALV